MNASGKTINGFAMRDVRSLIISDRSTQENTQIIAMATKRANAIRLVSFPAHFGNSLSGFL
jgi:hypothetical protein